MKDPIRTKVEKRLLEKPNVNPLPEETRLYRSHLPAILEEMNKILAQEED